MRVRVVVNGTSHARFGQPGRLCRRRFAGVVPVAERYRDGNGEQQQGDSALRDWVPEQEKDIGRKLDFTAARLRGNTHRAGALGLDQMPARHRMRVLPAHRHILPRAPPATLIGHGIIVTASPLIGTRQTSCPRLLRILRRSLSARVRFSRAGRAREAAADARKASDDTSDSTSLPSDATWSDFTGNRRRRCPARCPRAP